MRLIEAALSDRGSSGIVICGAAGVGKSRIAREALDSAASRGWVTHWAVGTSCARTLPLGAFTSWVPSDGADTVQLVRGVIESLTTTAPETTVVVGVDDVHLLGETFGVIGQDDLQWIEHAQHAWNADVQVIANRGLERCQLGVLRLRA